MTSEEIKHLRKKHGFKSAEAFAHAIGMQPTTIKRWECGAMRPSRSCNIILRLFEKHGPEIFYALNDRAIKPVDSKIFTHLTEEGYFK